MKYLIVVFLCLTLNSCEKEEECCSYNYWTTHNSPLQLNSECDCCYDLAGRKINCPL
tara:strand:+ start:3793 stop:3963 length:171 start_codon:yes stop_codon:yes gene_type:complete